MSRPLALAHRDLAIKYEQLKADLQIEQQQHAITRAERDEALAAMSSDGADACGENVLLRSRLTTLERDYAEAQAKIIALETPMPNSPRGFGDRVEARARLALVVKALERIVVEEQSLILHGRSSPYYVSQSLHFATAALAAAKEDEPEIVQANWDL